MISIYVVKRKINFITRRPKGAFTKIPVIKIDYKMI